MAKGAERLRCRPRIYCAKLEIAQAGVCSILELFHVAYGEGEAGEGAGGFAVGEELIDVGQVLVVAGLVEGVSGAVGRGEAHDGIALPLCVQLTVPWSTVRGHVWPSWSALMSWGLLVAVIVLLPLVG